MAEVVIAAQQQTVRANRLRRELPWTSCQFPPEFKANPYRQIELWLALADDLVAELTELRETNPSLAFERLMVVGQSVGRPFRVSFNDSEDNDLAPVRKAVPEFLRAISSFGYIDAADRTYAAIMHPELNAALIPSDMFAALSSRSRTDLIERLSVKLKMDSPEELRLRLVLSDIVLSETDDDLMLSTIEALHLWRRVSPARLVKRATDCSRLIPKFADFAVDALLLDAPSSECANLLERSLELCGEHGKPEIAQAILLRLQEELLAAPLARSWLSYFPAERRRYEELQLLRAVSSDTRRGRALLFMLEWPALSDAAHLARHYSADMHDIAIWQLKEASLKLASYAPDVALRLFQKADTLRNPNDYEPETLELIRKPEWYESWSNT